MNDLELFQGAKVTLPNNVSIQSTEKGNIPFSSKLSASAKDASILPGLESSSLVSLGQLCDDDCEILLNKKSLFVIKENELILEGYRNQNDLLWDIPVSNPDILKSKHLTNPNGAGLYSVVANAKQYKPIPRQRKQKKLSPYKNIFQSFDDMIDFNDCVNTINEFSKNECTQSPAHKLNVIIRENQTKQDLANFLTAA